jgi:hypothetical protein
MNRRLFGTFGVIAALVASTVTGCKKDPLSDLDGNAAAVVTDFTSIQLAPGTSDTITARIVDGRFTPLAVPITFTACTSDLTVAPDPSYNPVPATSARVIITAVTANASCVVVSGGGISDSIAVAILPATFNGTASTATPLVGQPFSLYASTLLGFNPASANINFGGGVRGEIIRRVGDTLTVRVPQPDAAQPAPLTVENVAVKYVPGLTVTLPTATQFTVTNPFGAHTSGGPNGITIPADADSLVFYDGFQSGANGTSVFIDYFYPFTIASTDTITFEVSWNSAADLDFAICNGVFSGCTGGFGGATGANPERITVIFAPGNYNLFIESFDDHAAPAHLFKVVVRNP